MNAIPISGTRVARTSVEETAWAPPSLPAPHAIVSHAIDGSDDFARAWDDLAAHGSEANAFAERWFVMPSIAELSRPAGTRFVSVWAAERLIGLAILMPAKGYARLPIGYTTNWMHHHCLLGTPLVRRGEEERFWRALIEAVDGLRGAGQLLHFNGLVEDGPVHAGLLAATAAIGRPCEIVHRRLRALLESDLSPEAYAEQTIRKKKRKEFNRLANRLRDEGTVAFRTLYDAAELPAWCDAFLALEASGWKGEAGSSMGSAPHTARFFRAVAAGAFAAGKLELLRLDLDGEPIAMLVNLLVPPGAFSWKIAFDETQARYSPGVMIQLENLRILKRADIAWMDSCAVDDHPMINSLWGERRSIVRVTLPRAGPIPALAFKLCRTLERASAARRARRAPPPVVENQP